MTSFIERKVNEVCGRWLDGFTKDNVDVSLLQAKITLSDLHFKTDELCLLSPTFAPSFFYVGKLSIDIPLSWDLSRPVKLVVSDVLGVVRVRNESMTAEDARKSISASVHVKAVLSKLAAELGGGEAEGGKRAARINLQTVHNIHKVLRKLEVTVRHAHIRIEEPRREVLDDQNTTGEARGPPAPAVAFGICLRGISLGLDERAAVEDGGGSAGERWFGKKFRAMETALLGNFSRYDSTDGAMNDLQGDASSDAQSFATSDGARSDGADGSDPTGSEEWKLAVNKFASVRGASVYFCRDEECYSGTDVEETLRRLREDFKSPPTALPPLLRRCRAGVGLNVVFSAREWGKIESLDVRLLAGDINVQIGDDHLGYLLRWASLLDEHTRALALSALRPTKDYIAVSPSRSSASVGRSEKSRYYRALWRYAVEVVLRDLRYSVWQRFERARQELQSAQAARIESIDHNIPWSSEESEYRVTRGLLWRTWFAEWVGAARYLSVRQLIQTRLVVESFADESGGIHNRLYEDLEVEPTPPKRNEKTLGGTGTGTGHGTTGMQKSKSKSKSEKTTKEGGEKKKLAKYLMPWQLPQEDVDKAWSLITRLTLRWELREAGGIKQAIEEERADKGKLDAAVLQALWSIQLQLDAQLPHRICAFCRRMGFLRVGWRSRIDRLWQARAEKQRRLGLGLGDLPTPPRLTPNGSLSLTASEMGFSMSSPAPLGEAGANENASGMEDRDGGGDGEFIGGDGADRVGTLLVRMGQLDGIAGVGLLSLAPKAVATLMLEESSASLEEMNLETNVTEVAKYDPKNERCFWNQTFRLQVELNEDYVHGLRRERMKKHRRTSTGSSCGDLLGSSTNSTPIKSDAPRDRGGRLGDARSISLRGTGSMSPPRNSEAGRRRHDSNVSTRSQMGETSPLSSFLLAVSCVDKNIFGVNQLGKMTLPGKQLTAVPLKVLEHRCALFSPVTVGQQLHELTLETIFVPPGEDVVLAERKLSAIGKRRYLEDKLDMAESSSSSRRKASPGSAAALDRSRSPLKPPRSSLDNVGEREMKVLSLEPAESAGAIGIVGGSDAPSSDVQPSSGSTNGEESFSSQRSIPIVDTETPGKVTMSMRAAGITVVTYLGHGDGSSLPQEDQQDMHHVAVTAVTLTETSAREIETTAEIDAVLGKFSLAVEAATVQLLDKGLMQVAAAAAAAASTSAETASASPFGGSGRHNFVPRPQLMMVGPVGVEIASTRFVRTHGTAASRPVDGQSGLARYIRQYEEVASRPGGGDLRPAGAQGFPATPVTPKPDSQSPSVHRGGANTYDAPDRRDGRFWEAVGSWPMWDWRGRLKIGAYTAELGKCNDRPGLEEVWRRFRFSMPKSALEDTQVLRRGLISASGAAQSSIWLLKAGARGLAVDVQMPIHEQTEVSRAPSPKSYVYVSSSESDTGSPPQSPSSSWASPSPSPVAVNREKSSPSRTRTPLRLNRDSSAFFPGAEEECIVDSNVSRPPNASTELPPVEDRARGASVPAGSVSSISELSENEELNVSPSNEQLLRRVQELEEEIETLRAATAAAAAAAGVLGSSTPIVAVEGGDAPQI